jgi:hypothetical protein
LNPFDRIDVESVVEVQLDAIVIIQHLEANLGVTLQELLIGIDADVKMVIEKIVVGAIPSVLAAKDLGSAWLRVRLCVEGDTAASENQHQYERLKSIHTDPFKREV